VQDRFPTLPAAFRFTTWRKRKRGRKHTADHKRTPVVRVPVGIRRCNSGQGRQCNCKCFE